MAVEFNEDLSAFHGPTLDSQIAYTSAAITYILSHYRPHTQLIIMGHSMGGVVGTALLPSEHVSALITMSAPHTLPPVRFDARVEEIYEWNRKVLDDDETPILSICGGATDVMIPSESCILPESAGDVHVYRRTVFTSALEGAWTGVGHREMVWCHQVRWRIARAALELGGAKSVGERGVVLDRWLRDGHLLPPTSVGGAEVGLKEGEYEVLPEDMHLVLRRPLGKRTYLLPVTSADDVEDARTFVLFVSQGSVSDVSPHHALNLRATVQLCTQSHADASVVCTPLTPTTLKLLPSPIPGKPFPVPDEGSDESEGVVLFEAQVPRRVEGWVGVSVDAGGDGGGWVVGGFDGRRDVGSEIGLLGRWSLDHIRGQHRSDHQSHRPDFRRREDIAATFRYPQDAHNSCTTSSQCATCISAIPSND
jgi:glycosylphosphatidylinositol deacylase